MKLTGQPFAILQKILNEEQVTVFMQGIMTFKSLAKVT